MINRLISLVLILLLVFGFSVNAAAVEGEVTVNENYTVIYGDSSLEPVSKKLAEYVDKISGEKLAVSDEGTAPFIKITTDNQKVRKGYNIAENNGNIIITGSSFAQTVRGVYAFVERFGGVRCYTDEITDYAKQIVTVPAGTDYSYTPYFEYTETDWMSPRNTEYSLFNGINGADYRSIPKEMGGNVEYIAGLGHTLSNRFCSRDKYYADHPEYFALYRGVRTDKQLCLSNPDVLEIVADEVLSLLKEKYNPASPLQIVSLTQNDTITFCTCDKCKKTDRKYSSHAGTYLEFVNEIARRVKKQGYDNVLIDTFAYRYTRTPPKGIVPEDNVCVRLCSIECCFSHALDDSDCVSNAAFMNDLKEWSKICNRLYIWDYCTNYCNYVGLFPDFGTLQRNMQIFYENNVKGIYEEGNYSNPPVDAEFGELRSYLISCLFKNPYCDLTAERNAFLNAYYGGGAEEMGRFLDMITENAGKGHLGIYESMTNTLTLNRKEIKTADNLWKSALAKAEGDAKQHIADSQISWRWWKMKNRKSEFGIGGDYKGECKKLYDYIAQRGIKTLMEVDGTRSFFASVYQKLYFNAYPLVNGILQLLYGLF